VLVWNDLGFNAVVCNIETTGALLRRRLLRVSRNCQCEHDGQGRQNAEEDALGSSHGFLVCERLYSRSWCQRSERRGKSQLITTEQRALGNAGFRGLAQREAEVTG